MNRRIQLGIIMDPIEQINVAKDSSFAMLLAAQARGWALWYMELQHLELRDSQAYAWMQPLEVCDDPLNWYRLGTPQRAPLSALTVILMRKDPPFDWAYIATTYLLEHAEAAGSLVINKPQSLRDANEKLYTAWFPQCCVPTLVSCQPQQLRAFLNEHQHIILKPLVSMGGDSIFQLVQGDANTSVILELMTDYGQQLIMAQRFIPEITQGDKRILLIDGEPIAYALARIPASGEIRGNLAAGGQGKGVALTPRDRWICAQVGATLRDKGLLFVGLDVIGDYLTEINVTSPTCIRQLDNLYQLDIAGQLMRVIENKLALTLE
ncbi:MAG: glutathione synthase [Pseudomonadota bacterium]|nr:glutathione synthase [Pseudomonadota bacterium]